MRKLLLAALLLTAAVCAQAQYATVSATHFSDLSGNLINGTVHFKPNIPFRLVGRGQVISNEVKTLVTNGVFTLQIADTTQTQPVNISYNVWATDTLNRVIFGSDYPGNTAGYGTVQVTTQWCSAGACNFDNFNPQTPAAPLLPFGLTGAGILAINSTGSPHLAGNADIVSALGFTPENLVHKDQALGYPSLDSTGLIPSSEVPPQAAVQLAGVSSLPTCNAALRGKFAFVASSGSSSDTTDVCINTGGGAYAWLSLGSGTSVPVVQLYTDFATTLSVGLADNAGNSNFVATVWDLSGSLLAFSDLQIVDSNNVSLTFAQIQSGAMRLSPANYTLAFTSATSVAIPHNLGTLNIVPQVFDATNHAIGYNTFTLTDSNNATLTFSRAQTGVVRFLTSASSYSNTYSTSCSTLCTATINHGLNSLQIASAVYDTGNNLIQYDSFTPSGVNNAVLTTVTAQSGRVVVIKP